MPRPVQTKIKRVDLLPKAITSAMTPEELALYRKQRAEYVSAVRYKKNKTKILREQRQKKKEARKELLEKHKEHVRNTRNSEEFKQIKKALLTPVQNTKGRTKRYTPETLTRVVNKYLDFCREHDVVPCKSGLSKFMGVTTSTVSVYEKDPSLGCILEQFQATLEAWLVNDLYNSPANSNMQLVAKQLCNWTDKQEVVTTTITKEAAIAKLERLAPHLLEVLKQRNVLDVPQKVQAKISHSETVLEPHEYKTIDQPIKLVPRAS